MWYNVGVTRTQLYAYIVLHTTIQRTAFASIRSDVDIDL